MPPVGRLLPLFLALSLLPAAGCSCGLGCGAGDLEVAGAHPYRRCLMDDPPEPGSRRVGEVGVSIDERTLRIDAVGVVAAQVEDFVTDSEDCAAIELAADAQ